MRPRLADLVGMFPPLNTTQDSDGTAAARHELREGQRRASLWARVRVIWLCAASARGWSCRWKIRCAHNGPSGRPFRRLQSRHPWERFSPAQRCKSCIFYPTQISKKIRRGYKQQLVIPTSPRKVCEACPFRYIPCSSNLSGLEKDPRVRASKIDNANARRASPKRPRKRWNVIAVRGTIARGYLHVGVYQAALPCGMLLLKASTIPCPIMFEMQNWAARENERNCKSREARTAKIPLSSRVEARFLTKILHVKDNIF